MAFFFDICSNEHFEVSVICLCGLEIILVLIVANISLTLIPRVSHVNSEVEISSPSPHHLSQELKESSILKPIADKHWVFINTIDFA